MHKLLKKLARLDLPESEYAIFGSGPLAIRGLKEANDLDIVVSNELFNTLAEKYGQKVPGKIEIEGEDIEIFSSRDMIFGGEEVIKRAEKIDGFKFISLEDTISWKQKLGREKDLADIEIIKEYLDSDLGY